MAKEKKSHKGLRMTDSMKQKYAQLFLDELDSLEAHEFKMPWVNPRLGAPCNIYRQGKPYRKSNAFFLTMLVSLRGWNTPLFITKTQMENEDGKLKYDGLRANATPILDEDGMVTLDKRGMPAMDYERRFPVIYYKPLHYDADGNKISDEDWDEMDFDGLTGVQDVVRAENLRGLQHRPDELQGALPRRLCSVPTDSRARLQGGRARRDVGDDDCRRCLAMPYLLRRHAELLQRDTGRDTSA